MLKPLLTQGLVLCLEDIQLFGFGQAYRQSLKFQIEFLMCNCLNIIFRPHNNNKNQHQSIETKEKQGKGKEKITYVPKNLPKTKFVWVELGFALNKHRICSQMRNAVVWVKILHFGVAGKILDGANQETHKGNVAIANFVGGSQQW